MLQRLLALSSFLLTNRVLAQFSADCFEDGDLYGFDPQGQGKAQEITDALILHRQRLMEDESRPWAFKFCYDDGVIKSIQTGLMSGSDGADKVWLSVIGDKAYARDNECPIYKLPENRDLVVIFMNIGYSSRGVNYVSFVFAPTYDNDDDTLEVKVDVGNRSGRMEFVNIAFTQKNAFVGLTGITSQFGQPINSLGAVMFKCAKSKVDKNNLVIREDGLIISGGGEIVTEEDIQKDKQKAARSGVQPGDESDNKGSKTLTVGIWIAVVVMALIAIAAILALFLRSKKRIKQAEVPQQEAAPANLPHRQDEENSRAQLHRNQEGMENVVVEPPNRQQVDGAVHRILNMVGNVRNEDRPYSSAKDQDMLSEEAGMQPQDRR